MTKILEETFAEKFARILKENNFTHQEFAEKIDRSAPTVGRWVRGTSVPNYDDFQLMREIFDDETINDLLNTPKPENIYEEGGVTWSEHVKDFKNFEEMRVGAGFFKSFVLGKKNFEEVRSQLPYNNYDIHACYALTQSALRSGVIRIQDVKRHEECEEKLRKKFGLTQCIVADVESHDGTVIRAEYIAFLATIH